MILTRAWFSSMIYYQKLDNASHNTCKILIVNIINSLNINNK